MNSLLGLLLLCQSGCKIIGVEDNPVWTDVFLQTDSIGVYCIVLKMQRVHGKTKSVMEIKVNRTLCSTIDLFK